MPPPCVGCGSEPHGCCLGTRGWSPGRLWDAVLGPLGGRFGDSWGLFWASWGPPGRLGVCLDRLGAILGRLGRLLGLLEPSWAPSRDQLGPFWAPRGESGRPLGPPWTPHGLLRGKLGGVLGASWTVFNAVKTANAFKLKTYIVQYDVNVFGLFGPT